MPKRPITYTSRDFESIKDDLMTYAKRYYPSTYKDFNEASFGSLMLDLVAYVGDQLSFYLDYQANESFMNSAIEYNNVIRIAQQLGYKIPGAAQSIGTNTFYLKVPAKSDGSGPDRSYLPTLREGTLLGGSAGAFFTLNEDVNFAAANNEVTISEVDPDTGNPTWFAVRTYGQVISGRQFTDIVSIGEYSRFLQVVLDQPDVTQILSIVDGQGNEYYEVPNLSQDIVYVQSLNYGPDRTIVPYIMKAKPVPRRFTTEFDTAGTATVQFGYGSADNLTTDVIVDPADVSLDVIGRNYVTSQTFDPTDLITSDKFGVVPANTDLVIRYISNTAETANAAAGDVNVAISPNFVFENRSTLSSGIVDQVIASLETENDEPILGDTTSLSSEEIKVRAYASYAAQNRAVTREDYVTLVYRMPSKFGSIKRANIIADTNSYKRNLNMYVLAEDTDGNFVAPPMPLKQNLKTWISRHKMINDTIDILDGRVINYGINFEIIAGLDSNRYEVLQACVDKLKDKLKVKNNIGQAVYISEIYRYLNDVPGVVDATNVELTNLVGGAYSNYVYDINTNLSADGRFLTIPHDAVAEILNMDEDILGAVT